MTQPQIERTLETFVDFADIHRQSLSKLTENVDVMAVQIGFLPKI